VHSLTYQLWYWCGAWHGDACVSASGLGADLKTAFLWLRTLVLVLVLRIHAPSTPSRNPENLQFSGMREGVLGGVR